MPLELGRGVAPCTRLEIATVSALNHIGSAGGPGPRGWRGRRGVLLTVVVELAEHVVDDGVRARVGPATHVVAHPLRLRAGNRATVPPRPQVLDRRVPTRGGDRRKRGAVSGSRATVRPRALIGASIPSCFHWAATAVAMFNVAGSPASNCQGSDRCSPDALVTMPSAPLRQPRSARS